MSSSASPIAVTGATGQLGGRVARRAGRRRHGAAAAGARASRAPQLPGAGAVRAPYGDAWRVQQALDRDRHRVHGVRRRRRADRVEQHRSVRRRRRGRRRASTSSTLSFFGAAPDATFTLARDHWATEQHIRRRGLPHTFLRDNLYADFLPGPRRRRTAHPRSGRRRPDRRGGARTTSPTPRSAVLRDPDAHAGRSYDLTGPAALTLTEVAGTITRVTGPHGHLPAETRRAGVRLPRRLRRPAAGRWTPGSPPTPPSPRVSSPRVTTAIPELTGHPATPLAQVLLS